MEEILEKLRAFASVDQLGVVARISFLLFVVLPLVIIAATLIRKLVAKRFTIHHGLLAGKVVRYGGVVLVFIIIFQDLGFSLAPLLGAAGIFGVAIAFASQTSVSNIISGLFLIAEKSFALGDAITVNGTTGIVLSIDTLSVKLRTFDNRFIRIPNETLIKSDLINITRFPIRRVDVHLGVSYDSDLALVRSVLLDVATKNPLCLIEPKPIIVLQGFGASSIDLLFGVWVTKEKYLDLKNSIQAEVKESFDVAGIEIPFPQQVVHWKGDPVESGKESES